MKHVLNFDEFLNEQFKLIEGNEIILNRGEIKKIITSILGKEDGKVSYATWLDSDVWTIQEDKDDKELGIYLILDEEDFVILLERKDVDDSIFDEEIEKAETENEIIKLVEKAKKLKDKV